MCLTCGCGEDDVPIVRVVESDGHAYRHNDHDHDHDHAHGRGHDRNHGHGHRHDADERATETLILEERLLAKNDQAAERVRAALAERDVCAVNVMSSPGAGKTSLLERTIAERGDRAPVCVIEGDQETVFDAERIVRAGGRAVQVNTGSGCHLDADMVRRAVDAIDPPYGSLLFVENVGNLVCPALFDVGERAKVVVISVTEGDDKPLKYPHMFAVADLVVVNKVDLLPYVDFDLDRLVGQAGLLSPRAAVLPMSVRTGEGIGDWHDWLDSVSNGVREGAPRGAAIGS